MKDLQKPTQSVLRKSQFMDFLDVVNTWTASSFNTWNPVLPDQLARDFLDLNQLFVSNSSVNYQWTYFAANNCCSKRLPSTWRVAWVVWDG